MAEPWRHGGVFDAFAEAYDTHRSGYPREIVRAAVELAGLSAGARVVEVGSGTGKLTEELVACGLRVDAVEPGSNMIEVARRRVNDSDLVRFHPGRFEDVSLPVGLFDAVFSGSAFHWVDPSLGWAKAAALLRPGGTLALLQPVSVRDEADGTAVEELEEVFARLAPEIAGELPALRDLATIRAGVEARRENVSEVWAWLAHPGLAVAEAGKLFGPATFTAVRRIQEQTAEELWARFETTAIHHRLTPQVRVALQAEDERIIERAGGTLRSTQLVALVTASTLSRGRGAGGLLAGDIGAEYPDVAVWVAERHVAHTPGSVDRTEDDRDSTLGEIGAQSVHVVHEGRQLKARPRIGIGQGYPPERLLLDLAAREQAQEQVVEFEDDRAVSLVGRGSLENALVELLRTLQILDEERDHVDGLQRLSHLLEPPA